MIKHVCDICNNDIPAKISLGFSKTTKYGIKKEVIAVNVEFNLPGLKQLELCEDCARQIIDKAWFEDVKKETK